MANTKKYIVNSDGWVAGHRRKEGDVVELTEGQAKYEDVTLKDDSGPDVQLIGSLDDPLDKKSGLDKKRRTAAAKAK